MNTIDALETRDIHPKIATEIAMSRDALLSGRRAEDLRRKLVERGVLVFRRVGLSDEELAVFARSLGPIMSEAGSEVLTMSLNKDDTRVAAYLKASQFWHIDNVGRGCPNFASMLLAREVPSAGGETEFANMYAAWGDLPDAEKASLEGLRVRHSFEHFQRHAIPDPTEQQLREWRSLPPSEPQPLVWRHESGRRSLAVSSSGFEVVGMDADEGRRLLDRLIAFATQPQYVYRHRWSVGDLVVWDNSGTMHRGRPHPEGEARRMARAATAGLEALQ